MNKLWDILLFPSKLYEKLTDNKGTLVAGILFIGLSDFYTSVIDTWKRYFTGKSIEDIRFNIAISVFMVLLLSIIDTVFFAVPLFDFFKYIKKREEAPHQATLIKVIKVYVLSSIIMLPVNIAAYFTVFRHINNSSGDSIINLALALLFIILIWSTAIVTRGINTLFNFTPLTRRITFIAVFIWNLILQIVFSTLIIEWLFKLFH